MYKVESMEVPAFEFERDGKQYSVPSPAGMRIEELDEYAQALDSGGAALTKWLVGFFREHCPKATKDMRVAELQGLYAAWQSFTGSSGE